MCVIFYGKHLIVNLSNAYQFNYVSYSVILLKYKLQMIFPVGRYIKELFCVMV